MDNQTQELIIQLADKLGITISEISRIFITAQSTLGYIWLVLLIFGIIMISYSAYKTYKCLLKNDNIDEPIMVLMFYSFLYTMIYLTIASSLQNILIAILLPEYSGLIEMISLLR